MTIANLKGRASKLFQAASVLAKSERRYKVFEAVYYHKKRKKSVSEIVERSGLNRMQVLQAGGQLRKFKLVDQSRMNGETAYEQIDDVMALKPEILRLAKNPARLRELAQTELPDQTNHQIVFAKPITAKRSRAPTAIEPRRPEAKLRIGFLSTNPDPDEPLRTDKEVREIKAEIRGAKYFNQTRIEHIPAADITSLLNLLNDFEPHVLQFSGHGGGQSLYFDDSSKDLAGGMSIDFDLINAVLGALNTPPELLVFSACDTLKGAEQFLETAGAVVAMSSSIGDSSAIMFSARFYAALLAGQNLQSALEQGKVVLKAMGREDADFPTVITANGISPQDILFF